MNTVDYSTWKETATIETLVHGEWIPKTVTSESLEDFLVLIEHAKELGIPIRASYSFEPDEDSC